MKILLIIPQLDLGGAETMVENLACAFKDKQQDVTVISLYSQKTPITQRLEEKNVRIIYLDKKLHWDNSIVKKLRQIIMDEKPDILHTHLYAFPYVLLANRRIHIKCVHTFHSLAHKEQEKLGQVLMYYFLKRKKIVPVAISPEVKDSISQLYRIGSDRILTVRNGVDLTKCIIKKNYYTKDEFVIIHVAKMRSEKNQLLLIHAFYQALQTCKNIKLWMVGDGQMRNEIERRIEELGIRDSVKLYGNISNVYPLLNQADIFLLTSVYEGLPMSIIEAMGTGLPVIATNVGGIPHLIENGVNGILTESDENSIAEHIVTLVNDDLMRKTLGYAALKKANAFSAQKMAEEYLCIYNEKLSDSRKL